MIQTTPEIGKSIRAGGVMTNYHEAGSGIPVILIHGSGPGVLAWANWRLAIPHLSERLHVFACGIDPRDILTELGRRQAVAGQEDWILDVALELARDGRAHPPLRREQPPSGHSL